MPGAGQRYRHSRHVITRLFELGYSLKQVRVIVDGRACVEKFAERGYADVDKEVLRVYARWQNEGAKKDADVRDEAEPIDEADNWPDPEPLPNSLPPVLPFNFELLPDRIRAWAEDVVTRMQAPADFAAVASMVALGATLGRKVAIRPKEKDDAWQEAANLWGLSIARPGTKKSPVLEECVRPLKRLSALAQEGYEVARTLHAQQKKYEALREAEREKHYKRKLKDNPDEPLPAPCTSNEPREPTLRRYIASDTSVAALGELLVENQNGLLCLHDEIIGLLRSLNRDDRSEDRTFYLQGWNGTSDHRIDRIGRGKHIYIPALCLSLLGSTQPARISQFVYSAVKGGEGDDGLLQRFQLAVWPDLDKPGPYVDRPENKGAKERAFQVFDDLDKLAPEAVGATQDRHSGGTPDRLPYLRFGKEAQTAFRTWLESHEARLISGEFHPAMEAHLSKYRGLVPALALVIGLADGNHGAISERALTKAIGWAAFLESHANRLYASAVSAERMAAKGLAGKIKSGALPVRFSVKDIQDKDWAGLADNADIVRALEFLEDRNWLRSTVKKNPKGGRPKTTYEVNPKVQRICV
ncbi:MAG: YfjI family protein [Rhodomicrobium sp.]